MAVTIDTGNVTSLQTTAGVSTYSFNVTIASGDNCLVLLEGNASGPGGTTVSSATYGGVSLTQVPSSSAIQDEFETSIWYLLNPAVGTASLAVTLNAAQGFIAAGAIPLIGVNTSVPLGTCTTNQSNTTTNPLVTATGAGANDLYLGVTHNFNPFMSTAGANQTNQWSQQNIGNTTSAMADSIPGSFSGAFSWTGTGVPGNTHWTAAAVAFLAAAVGDVLMSQICL